MDGADKDARPAAIQPLRGFRFRGGDVARDILQNHGFDGDLAGIYADHDGHLIHKWHHYIPLYDRYLSPWRNRPLRFLEIGVSKGGSLEMWRKYFGPGAVIFGIDIDPACAELDGIAARVRIGSQNDAAFLIDVLAEMGGVDVVLDDGSHHMRHVRRSMQILFPRMSYGGIYIVEDMHTAYLPQHGGGREAEGNFFTFVREICDDMHHWYHGEGMTHGRLRGEATGIHIHDSFVVFEKAPSVRPTCSTVGGSR